MVPHWEMSRSLRQSSPPANRHPIRIPVMATVYSPGDTYVCRAWERDVILSVVPSPHSTVKLYDPRFSSGRRIWFDAEESEFVRVVFHRDTNTLHTNGRLNDGPGVHVPTRHGEDAQGSIMLQLNPMNPGGHTHTKPSSRLVHACPVTHGDDAHALNRSQCAPTKSPAQEHRDSAMQLPPFSNGCAAHPPNTWAHTAP